VGNGHDHQDDVPSLGVYESVRCLACDTEYAKPARGGTATANPGCPECGYVGWVALSVSPEATRLHRFDGGPRLGRSAQSR
jgi:hypothetical protein